MTHLERDWRSPVWRHWLAFLSDSHSLVRYDERGSGLSDRGEPPVGLEEWIHDLETVVDAAGLQRFPLFGICQGGPVAIAYAARHPERVSHLILYGTYARGKLRRPDADVAEADALIALTKVDWGRSSSAYRRMFTNLFVPGATEAQMMWIDELQRISASPGHAARVREVKYEIDVTDAASAIQAPTLVVHARQDALVPFEEGRHLASTIPQARFVPVGSANHILLENEPAWKEFTDAMTGFLPTVRPPDDAIEDLSPRERDVLSLIATGADNQSIARALHISVRTVERHLSNSYAKLGVSGKAARAAAAARYARQDG